MMQVFLTTYSYIIDPYGANSASALSALTLIRYNVSGVLIRITEPLYNNIGIRWTASLIGFVSLSICFVCILFYITGPKIRRLSKLTAPSLIE